MRGLHGWAVSRSEQTSLIRFRPHDRPQDLGESERQLPRIRFPFLGRAVRASPNSLHNQEALREAHGSGKLGKSLGPVPGGRTVLALVPVFSSATHSIGWHRRPTLREG